MKACVVVLSLTRTDKRCTSAARRARSAVTRIMVMLGPARRTKTRGMPYEGQAAAESRRGRRRKRVTRHVELSKTYESYNTANQSGPAGAMCIWTIDDIKRTDDRANSWARNLSRAWTSAMRRQLRASAQCTRTLVSIAPCDGASKYLTCNPSVIVAVRRRRSTTTPQNETPTGKSNVRSRAKVYIMGGPSANTNHRQARSRPRTREDEQSILGERICRARRRRASSSSSEATRRSRRSTRVQLRRCSHSSAM
jgi:hypothetical protein